MKIGECIKQARNQTGRTQDELAAALGVHAKTVSTWECGTKTPRADKLLEICNALDITIGQLLPSSGEQLDLAGMSADDIREIRLYAEFRRALK